MEKVTLYLLQRVSGGTAIMDFVSWEWGGERLSYIPLKYFLIVGREKKAEESETSD